jgi:hypothetical protein
MHSLTTATEHLRSFRQEGTPCDVLSRLLAREGGALRGADVADSKAHQLLAVGRLPAEAVALAWAQSCDGVLVADAGGR